MNLQSKLPGKIPVHQVKMRLNRIVAAVSRMSFAMQQYLIFACLLILPVLVDVILWKSFVVPQQVKYRELKVIQNLIKQKPVLEALTKEARESLEDWMARGFMKGEGGAFREMQHIAATEGIVIKDMRFKAGEAGRKVMAGSKEVSFLSALPMTLQLQGSFVRVMRWMNGVENNPGLQFQTISLESDESGSANLYADINILVGRL